MSYLEIYEARQKIFFGLIVYCECNARNGRGRNIQNFPQSLNVSMISPCFQGRFYLGLF